MKKELWSAIAVISLFGCTSSSTVDQARALGNQTFSKATWAAASQERRGEMVASFLSQHAPSSLSANTVKELLGPPTGYYDYDENVAYFVGPQSVQSQYGKGYLLAFVTDKTSGKITSVKIIPEPRP
jgi:hypothetical protein